MSKINIVRFKAVLEAIEDNPNNFDMSDWYIGEEDAFNGEDFNTSLIEHTCSSTACVAGWAVALFGTPEQRGQHDAEDAAADILGLSHEEAADLFYSWGHRDESDSAEDHAIGKLKAIIEAGHYVSDV